MLRDHPLVHLGQWLRETGYRFVTVTPATHTRVNARVNAREARSIEDVFGWSRPFRPSLLPAVALRLLEEAGALERRGELFFSSVRDSGLYKEQNDRPLSDSQRRVGPLARERAHGTGRT